MTQTIQLVGGEGNGTVIHWQGGDFLRYLPPIGSQRPPLPEASPSPKDDISPPWELYRRSARNPLLFVFQP